MKIFINIIAVVLGLVIGMVVNMLIIKYGSVLIPNPDGYINTNEEGMRATMHLLTPKHFIIPWLAHALGTLSGAIIAFKIARIHQFYMASIVSLFFLVGGTYMVIILPSPTWFNIVDLGLAYIPMAWIANKIFST